jgi:ABC-type glycerol-3-phosphate transport system permease component
MTNSLNLSNAPIGSYVVYNLTYTDSYGVTHSSIRNYPISNASYPTWTLAQNQNEKYGLSLFDRIIIMMITLMIAGGLAYLFADKPGAALMGLFVIGFYVSTGFIPLWVVIVPVIALFVMMGASNR